MTETSGPQGSPQPDRLDRIEAILTNIAEQQAVNTQAIADLRSGLEETNDAQDLLAGWRVENQNAIAAVRGEMGELVKTVGQVALSLDNFATMTAQAFGELRRRQEENSAQIQVLIDEGRAVSQKIDRLADKQAANDEQIAENNRQIQVLIEESRDLRGRMAG